MQISPSAVILGSFFFNAPGCLSISYQLALGQLQAGLSNHRAPVTPLAVVQPNL